MRQITKYASLVLSFWFLFSPSLSLANGGSRFCDGGADEEFIVSAHADIPTEFNTICYWMKSDGTWGTDGGSGGGAQGTGIFWDKTPTGGADGIRGLSSNSLEVIDAGSTISTLTKTSSIFDSEWHHICVTVREVAFGGNTIRLYVNGVEEDNTTIGSGGWADQNEDLVICGEKGGTFYEEIEANMAYFEWHNTWFNSPNIINEIRFKPCSRPANQTFCLRMWEDNATEPDASGNGHSATQNTTINSALDGPPVILTMGVSGG